MKPELRSIPLDQIRIDGGTQIRVGQPDPETVEEYAAHLDLLPPAEVYFDGQDHWLADGFHRYRAHRKANRTTMRVRVHNGSQRDALLQALGANANHGLRRTNADKRRAVGLLLTDPEWGQWSDRAIAKAAGVSHTFVSDIRNESPTAGESECPTSGNGCHPAKQAEPPPVEDAPSLAKLDNGEDAPVDGAERRDEEAAAASTDPKPWDVDYNDTLVRNAERAREMKRDLERLAREPGDAGSLALWLDDVFLTELENLAVRLEERRALRWATDAELPHLPSYIVGKGEQRQTIERKVVLNGDYKKGGPLFGQGKRRKGARS